MVGWSLGNSYINEWINYAGTNEGEITVSAGEELIVLEKDMDDTGWTQVLRGDDEGYVPTAYIQISD